MPFELQLVEDLTPICHRELERTLVCLMECLATEIYKDQRYKTITVLIVPYLCVQHLFAELSDVQLS